MSVGDSAALGNLGDVVELTLGGEVVQHAESYEVHKSVWTAQPSAFSLRFGWGGVARALVAKGPPNTPFELRVGGQLLFTGNTDGFDIDESAGPGTEVTVRGRDDLAPLHDAFVESDESYSDITYADLVKRQLELSGISGYSLVFTNDANRKVVSGTTVTPTKPVLEGESVPDVAPVKQSIRFKAGERRYERLKKELDRAGLFLFAGTEKTFVLTAPTVDQGPSARILRLRGATRNAVNVLHARWHYDTAHRYAGYDVLGRGGGAQRGGRHDVSASHEDAEMAELGFTKRYVARESHPRDKRSSEFLARRRASEANRAGWQLQYTVAGHRVPLLGSPGQTYVWSPDTVVHVDDAEFGIIGDHYLESCAYRRDAHGGTTTELTLQRKEDLVFGTDD